MTAVFRMVDLVVFLKANAVLLKFFSNSTRGLVLEERSSSGIFASGFFRSTLLQVPQVGTFFSDLGSL